MSWDGCLASAISSRVVGLLFGTHDNACYKYILVCEVGLLFLTPCSACLGGTGRGSWTILHLQHLDRA